MAASPHSTGVAAPLVPPMRPLRVLHVITRMIVGGAQENTMLSCALIDRRRFPSEILTGPQTGTEGELHGETRARGVVLHVEPALVREVQPWKDLVALARLVRFIRRGRYDVVHTHCSKAGILGRIAAWMAGTPVIVHTMHGLPFNPAQSKPAFWANVWLERVCVRVSDAVPMVAEPDLEETLALGIGRPGQYLVIRSGIEIEAYRDVPIGRDAARARLGIPAAAFVVGVVGRLSFQKAPLDMIAAFRRVAEARAESHLVMVGDGDLRAEVEAAIRDAGLADRVHLLGLRRDVPELMRAFDVLALPSRYEGMPRVFPQAMAARLPIVATRVDGAVEAIVQGENGWLVDVGDVPALADRLLAVAADRDRARRMGERGFERVEEFSARRMVDQLEELYTRLAVAKGLLPRDASSAGVAEARAPSGAGEHSAPAPGGRAPA
jgi:glycosyltransferase involved in cell wall biosynthesis